MRGLVLLGCLAALLRASAFVVSLPDPARQLEEDSRGYLALAANLTAEQRFGRQVRTGASEQTSWMPEIARTPGYPLLIAAAETIGSNARVATVAVQHVFGVGLCLLAAIVAGRAWGQRAGLVAGGLIAIDPQGIALGNMVLTESAYGVVLFVAVTLVILLLERPSIRMGAAAGLLTGVTALIRPTSIVLPIVLGAFVAIWRVRTRRLWAAGAALAVTGLTVIGLWTIRNGVVAGEFTFSAIGRYNLLACHAAGALARATDVDVQEATTSLCVKLGATEQQVRYAPMSAEMERRLRSLAFQTIGDNLGGFVKDYTLRTANMLLGPEKQTLTVLGLPWASFSGSGREPAPDASRMGLSWSVIAVEVALLGLLYVLVLRACWQVWQARRLDHLVAACAITALYVLVLSSGSPGDPRLRWPALPLLALIAASGFSEARPARARQA
jgi:4-amino-4-deoxy-L-arabinose transferase-like glycosyltransferase